MDVYDPWVGTVDAECEHDITPIARPEVGEYDAAVIGVEHKQFAEMGAGWFRALGESSNVLCDLKSILSADVSDLRLSLGFAELSFSG